MSSRVPPAVSRRRRGGSRTKMTPIEKERRAAKRKRKGTWAVRVWARRHIRGQV